MQAAVYFSFMKPLLAGFSRDLRLMRRNPADELTEDDPVYRSTLLQPNGNPQRMTTIPEIQPETSDENGINEAAPSAIERPSSQELGGHFATGRPATTTRDSVHNDRPRNR